MKKVFLSLSSFLLFLLQKHAVNKSKMISINGNFFFSFFFHLFFTLWWVSKKKSTFENWLSFGNERINYRCGTFFSLNILYGYILHSFGENKYGLGRGRVVSLNLYYWKTYFFAKKAKKLVGKSHFVFFSLYMGSFFYHTRKI